MVVAAADGADEAGASAEGVSELLHAPSATVRAAMAPMAASRWIFRTVFLLELGPVCPGRYMEPSSSSRRWFTYGM
jgi:hypothetical protein